MEVHPTIWRLFEYTDEAQKKLLAQREQLKLMLAQAQKEANQPRIKEILGFLEQNKWALYDVGVRNFTD